MSNSRRTELAITVLGFLGLALFLGFYDDVFPSAAIDLNLSRAEIAQRAGAYLRDQGYGLQGYESALAFEEDGWGSIYLQRTLGIPEANRLIRSEGLPIWFWHARWFRPLQKEEFSVYLSPNGEVVAYVHSVPEDAPGANLTQDEALALSEAYLTQDKGWALNDWEAVAASSEERPGGRTDHHFEWRRKDFNVGESELHLAVNIQGDRLGSYDYWLKVPEAFQRGFLERRDRASFLNELSTTIGFFAFSVAAFAALLLAMWRGFIPWRGDFGPAAAVAVVGLLAGLNQLPLDKIRYSTTGDYTLFWLDRLINLVFSVGFSAALVLVLWFGGQRLSKRVWRRRSKVLPRGTDRWVRLAHSSWRGLMLGGIMGGYLILFYLVATRLLGGWAPLDLPNTGILATPFPFLAPLEVGFLPAITEELMYRLVGISLILVLVRRRWLALLLPGALWGFAHLTHVRDPFFLRGIELTIAGVFLLGFFFLQFDLITAIVAHFAYNAGLAALPLLRSSEPYYVASGLIVVAAMLAPVLPGALWGLRHRLRGDQIEVKKPAISNATADDLTRLLKLPIEDLDWAALLNDPTALVVCVRASHEIIGVGAGFFTSDGQSEIVMVYVTPAWRRKYWGSRIVDALCSRFQENNVSTVQTIARPGDRVSEAFWASQGWQPSLKVYGRSLKPGNPSAQNLEASRHAKTPD